MSGAQAMTKAQEAQGRDACGAKKRNGAPCQLAPGFGTDHPGIGRCKFHGGSTPNHEKAARNEMARRAVVTYGLPRDIDPHDALREEIARTAGHVQWLGEVVAELEQQDLVFGVTDRAEGTDRGEETFLVTSKAGVNVWLELYHRERKHLVDVCKAAIACGIAEREVKLQEEQGHLIAQVLRNLIGDPELGLSPAQQEKARVVVSRHLRALPAA